MTYIEYVKNKIYEYDFGIPIHLSDLADYMAAEFNIPTVKASAAVSVAVKRLLERNEIDVLRFYQKGIYYRAKLTPFGETGINKDILISDKYLAGDNGFETGVSQLYLMGLTTQMPAERVYATNRASDCIRADKALGVYICPPKVRINSANKRYLQMLDAIETMLKAPVDAENPYSLMAGHIKKAGLDYGELLSIAGKYYNKNTVFTLARIAGERT